MKKHYLAMTEMMKQGIFEDPRFMSISKYGTRADIDKGEQGKIANTHYFVVKPNGQYLEEGEDYFEND